ncbi:MAG: N-acetyltransferase family protein [Ignavibacteria bacterium]
MEAIVDFATSADLPAMAELLATLFTLEADFRPDRDRQLRGLRLILDTPSIGRLFVVRQGNEVVGMANALITVSTAQGTRVALLEDVVLRQDRRGQGLGRKLVEHVCAWAKSDGLTRVTLLADRDNAPALAFYERLGFEPSAMVARRRAL